MKSVKNYRTFVGCGWAELHQTAGDVVKLHQTAGDVVKLSLQDKLVLH